MNDAERDAWLREALRHAPDSDALPPSGVSEAILLKARAAARAAQPSTGRAAAQAAPATAFAAFWAWLARPSVAAGFASVMAATLVGLMWWDQPMDETMPRPPAMTSERGDAAPPLASQAPAPTPAAPEAPTDAAKATPPARTEPATPPAQSQPTTTAAAAAAADGEIRRRQHAAPEQAAARDTKVAAPAAAAKPKPKADADAALAKERALPTERKNEAPAPFPSTEAQRETPSARQPLDKAANDAAKKVAEASRMRSTDAVERAALPPAAQSVAPAPTPAPVPSPVARQAPVGAATAPTAPLASGRLAADESRPAAAANNADAAMAKSAAGAAPSPAAPATTTAPARDIAAAPPVERAQRQRALGGAREKDAAGFSSSTSAPAPAPFRNELEHVRPDAATRAAPLARVLAAIAADPERWSRQTAGGDTFALDAGWRVWLAELDAAAAGRWRPLGGAGASADADAARDGATTLRLVSAGRVAAVVRFDGAMVHVDASPGSGADRWQATLRPASAERLRTAARRLSP